MTLPYKYRGLAVLVLLIVALPWTAWRFALRDTFGAWRGCRRISAQLAAMTPTEQPGNPSAPAAQGPELVLSGLLLDAVRQAAAGHSVQIAGYEPLVTLQQDGMAVHSAQLTLAGCFMELLQVVGELERSLPRCRLRSLGWHTATDRRARRTQLMLTLHMQQIVLIE